MEPDDKQKTAFATRRGLFQFKVMPFGLCCTPAPFERLMENVSAGLHWDICLVYQDDVIVAGKTLKEMFANLRKGFCRLQNAGLKLKAKKCCLFAEKVTYLGHVVSEEGVATDPNKTAAVKQWPVPTNAADNPKGQLARWLEILSTFSFEIQHRPGTQHSNADALSRVPCRQCGFDPNCEKDLRGCKPDKVRVVSQASGSKKGDDDPLLSMKDMEDENKDISLVERLVKERKRPEYSVCAKDTSSNKATVLLQAGTRMYIAGCEKKMGPQMKKRAPMELVLSGLPMDRIATDILGELPMTEDGNKYILLVSDCFTKWTKSFPMPNMEAKTVAKLIVEEVIARFGVPSVIHSDQGRQYESVLFEEMCQVLKLRKHGRTRPYHTQSDLMVERFNKTLVTMLSAYLNDHHSDWNKHLPFVIMVYMASVHETTGYTPNYLMLGRDVSTLDIIFEMFRLGQHIPKEKWAWELKETLEKAHKHVRENIKTAMVRQKKVSRPKVVMAEI
ncbi:uncharacterized protein LOC134282810 [Saccostrea cucullata]|uniref:uncharacterized protein LOC134282810 n=1 Tax=Saccostrea cuccullata TaxID=36930 RepID=UPI002ED5DF94